MSLAFSELLSQTICVKRNISCHSSPALPFSRTHLVALQGPSHRVVPSLLLALVVLGAQWVQPGLGGQPVLESLKTFRKEISCKLGHC